MRRYYTLDTVSHVGHVAHGVLNFIQAVQWYTRQTTAVKFCAKLLCRPKLPCKIHHIQDIGQLDTSNFPAELWISFLLSIIAPSQLQHMRHVRYHSIAGHMLIVTNVMSILCSTCAHQLHYKWQYLEVINFVRSEIPKGVLAKFRTTDDNTATYLFGFDLFFL